MPVEPIHLTLSGVPGGTSLSLGGVGPSPVQARVAATTRPPQGAVHLYSDSPLAGYVRISGILRGVRLRTEAEGEGAYIQVRSLIGAVRARVGKRAQGMVSVRSVIGRVRGMAEVTSLGWLGANLPLPLVSGYQYGANDLLVRTQMASGVYRQRRQWRDGYRTASMTFEIDRVRLSEIEEFLNEHGSDWFQMPLVTGDNPSAVAITHTVRLAGNPSVSSLQANQIQVTIPLDIQSATSVDSPAEGLAALTICLIDESSPYVGSTLDSWKGTTIGAYWIQDLTDFFAMTGGYTERAVVFDVRRNADPTLTYAQEAIWPYASGQPLPCPIYDTPRGHYARPVDGQLLTGEWLYTRIRAHFGVRTYIRRVRIFIDNSGSMSRVHVATGLDELIAAHSDEFIFDEYECPNERWLRWLINAERGILDCGKVD